MKVNSPSSLPPTEDRLKLKQEQLCLFDFSMESSHCLEQRRHLVNIYWMKKKNSKILRMKTLDWCPNTGHWISGSQAAFQNQLGVLFMGIFPALIRTSWQDAQPGVFKSSGLESPQELREFASDMICTSENMAFSVNQRNSLRREE